MFAPHADECHRFGHGWISVCLQKDIAFQAGPLLVHACTVIDAMCCKSPVGTISGLPLCNLAHSERHQSLQVAPQKALLSDITERHDIEKRMAAMRTPA